MEPPDDNKRDGVEKVIVLLTCALTLDDREIILLAIEDAIEMLREINIEA